MKRIVLVVSALAFAACGETPLIGQATATITQVPPQVSCIQVTVAGGRTVTRSFDVMPMQSSVLSMEGLPTGSVTFTAQAFAVACNGVNPMIVPTWLGDPVPATLSAGVVVPVTLILHKNGDANVTIDFQDDSPDMSMSPPPMAGLQASPTSVNFGTQMIGSVSQATINFFNTSATPTGPLLASLNTGMAVPVFSFVMDGCTMHTLAVMQSCSITVQYKPTTPMAQTTTLTVSGMPGGSVGVPLSGNAGPLM